MTTSVIESLDRAEHFIASQERQKRDYVAETQARLVDAVTQATGLADELDAFRAKHADFLNRVSSVPWRRLSALCGPERIEQLLRTLGELHGLLDNARGLRNIRQRVTNLPEKYRVAGQVGLQNEEASILATVRIHRDLLSAVAQRLGRLQALVSEATSKLPAAAQPEGLAWGDIQTPVTT